VNQEPDVEIVIVGWNVRDLVRACLRSIYRSDGLVRFAVHVVDNGSGDGTVEMLQQEFPQVHVLANDRNVGFAVANNQGLRQCRGRYVLCLNSDTILRPDTLSSMVAFLDAHRDAGAAGCRLLNADGSFQLSFAYPHGLGGDLKQKWIAWGTRNSRWFRQWYARRHEQVEEVGVVVGAFLMVRREVIEQIGAFDESFFMYFEDSDWCYRIRQQGWKVFYVPEVEIIHLHGQTSKQRSRQFAVQFRQSQLKFYAQHLPRFSFHVLRVALVAKALINMGRAWVRGWGARRNVSREEIGQVWWPVLRMASLPDGWRKVSLEWDKDRGAAAGRSVLGAEERDESAR